MILLVEILELGKIYGDVESDGFDGVRRVSGDK